MAVLPTGIGPVTGYNIERSLRFNSADSAYLNRTPASAGNRKVITISFWTKLTGSGFGCFLAANGGSGNNMTSIFWRGLGGTAKIEFEHFNGTTYALTTDAVYRDPSAWYHIVLALDTSQATAANRTKLYVNSVQQTVTGSYVPQNTDLFFNNNVEHDFGATINANAGRGNYFNGYMTEINFIDGQALTPSSFGETDSNTGVWKPKAFSGTYGTNGFFLKFADNSNTTAATLGKDSSGNGNNWTPNNFSVTAGAGNDSLVDSPTSYGTDTGVGGSVRGNYATMNPVASVTTPPTFTNGNLEVTGPSSGVGATQSTFGGTGGKFYVEVTVTRASDRLDLGIAGSLTASTFMTSTNYLGTDTNTIGYGTSTGVIRKDNANNQTGLATCTTGDVVGMAIDMDSGTIQFYKNNSTVGTAVSFTPSAYGSFLIAQTTSNNTSKGTYNFGQRAFAYTAPSGFKALCTQNLPTPTIGATSTTQANDYFNAVLYTGDDTNRTIDCGLQTDFIWTKGRNAAVGNRVSDSVRGASGGLMYNLVTNLTSAENTDTVVTGIVSNGFTLTGGNHPNNTGTTYVAWGWKANGAGSSNTAGTITSTVSANTTSGFSIVTYTGTGSNATVGHGIGTAPSMIFVKGRSGSGSSNSWRVYHSGANASPASGALYLNSTSAFTTDATAWNSTAPTSNVFSLGTDAGVNSTGTYVAYCFAPVAGYSAFGSYTGNASADGPFIYTGFRPKFIMIKSSSATGDWIIEDTSISPYNVSTAYLRPNTSDAETTGQLLDFVSNGYKIRVAVSSAMNASGVTYIYTAFAENPFKYSLAR